MPFLRGFSGKRLCAAWLMLPFLLAACGTPSEPVCYVEEPVVECLLVANHGIGEFKFTRTLPVTSPYDSARAGIQGARIVIRSSRGDSVVLRPVPNMPGLYAAPRYIIRPRLTYRLRTQFKDRTITAVTTVPDTFTLSPLSKTVITYLKDRVIVRWTRSEGSAAYFISVTNLEDSLVAIDRPYASQDPYSKRRARFYWTLGTQTELYPFLHNFYGRHELRVYAVDRNFFRYLQTSFQNPRELTEPESSVKNALGYFGSAVMHRTTYTLLE